MKTITKTEYRCDLCGAEYQTEDSARVCESRPVSEDKGVQVGDTVRVLTGDGAGQLATVKSRTVIDREWGHYAWERYWHTVGILADMKDSYGSRFLTFDSYEKV